MINYQEGKKKDIFQRKKRIDLARISLNCGKRTPFRDWMSIGVNIHDYYPFPLTTGSDILSKFIVRVNAPIAMHFSNEYFTYKFLSIFFDCLFL